VRRYSGNNIVSTGIENKHSTNSKNKQQKQMAKDIKFDIEARDGLKRGVDALANAVKVTLGPKVVM
jgi:hypothetical protein